MPRPDDDGDEPFRVGRARAVRATDKALYVQTASSSVIGCEALWIPRSVVHEDSECFDPGEGPDGDLIVKRWFAMKQGWVTE